MRPPALLLSAADVERYLDLVTCVDAIEAAMRWQVAHEADRPTSLGLRAARGTFHVKAAGLQTADGSFIAAKANINLPDNQARHGLPTIQGVLLLFDAETGAPLAVMDASAITTIRTGAATAVAVRHLARPEARTVTIVGCGVQGDIQLRAVAGVSPVEQAFVVDRAEARAAALADRLAGELGFPITPTSDLHAACLESEIVVTCTTATDPVLTCADLHPGLLVAAVGADNPDKQELDARMLPASRVVVDGLEAAAAGGELHHAIQAGLMRSDDVHGELAAVVGGRRPGRRSSDEVFVFDSVGTALQDVAAAAVVYRSAVAEGRATSFSLV